MLNDDRLRLLLHDHRLIWVGHVIRRDFDVLWLRLRDHRRQIRIRGDGRLNVLGVGRVRQRFRFGRIFSIMLEHRRNYRRRHAEVRKVNDFVRIQFELGRRLLHKRENDFFVQARLHQLDDLLSPFSDLEIRRPRRGNFFGDHRRVCARC